MASADVYERLMAGAINRDYSHDYLSTSCLHGRHLYCQATTTATHVKVPAQCKFCAAPCVCPCHQEDQA